MMTEITFRVRDAFPGDDPVGRWVAGLIVISNDLARPHRKLYKGMREGSREAKEQHAYWLMLGASHLREAVKFLDPDKCPLMSDPAVEEFVSDKLPAEARELLTGILEESQPWEESWLHELAKPARDRLFHYATDSDFLDEIGEALDAMAPMERTFDSEGQLIEWHWGFGEEIRLNWIAKAADLDEVAYAQLIQRSNHLAARIVKFARQAIGAYLKARA